MGGKFGEKLASAVTNHIMPKNQNSWATFLSHAHTMGLASVSLRQLAPKATVSGEITQKMALHS